MNNQKGQSPVVKFEWLHRRRRIVPSWANLNSTTGQSSLEVLIALTILVLAISAAIVVGFGNQSAVVDTELNSRAIYIATQELETLRANARQDFSFVASSTSQDGIYTKEISVNTLGTYSKEVKAKITWQLSPIQLRELILTTIITDWRTAWEQGKTGDGGTGLDGDWLNPLTADNIDLGAGNEGTDIAIRDTTVFVTGEASASAKDDLFSFDVTNINDVVLISSINTGPGLQSIAIWGDTYAYVANRNPVGQLQIVNILDPSSMSLVSTSSLLNNTELPRTIFAKDDYVYIGTSLSASGTELQIFDVLDPNNPSLEAEIEIDDHVNDTYVFRDRLYLATGKSNGQLMIYDVIDPESPSLIGTYDHPSGDGRSIFVTNYSDAYLGIQDEFHVMDTGDLGNITTVGSLNTDDDINDIYVRDELAFVGTNDNNGEFKVINIENPTSLTLQSEFNFPQIATGITYRDNVVYVSVRSNDALRIITSPNP